MSEWYTKCFIKSSPNKSAHTTFILCHSFCPTVSLQNVPILMSNKVRCLEINLDKSFSVNSLIRVKRLAYIIYKHSKSNVNVLMQYAQIIVKITLDV